MVTIRHPLLQVGNAVFVASFEYLVDLSYLWSTSTDLEFFNGTSNAYTTPGTVYLLNDTITKVFENQSIMQAHIKSVKKSHLSALQCQ